MTPFYSEAMILSPSRRAQRLRVLPGVLAQNAALTRANAGKSRRIFSGRKPGQHHAGLGDARVRMIQQLYQPIYPYLENIHRARTNVHRKPTRIVILSVNPIIGLPSFATKNPAERTITPTVINEYVPNPGKVPARLNQIPISNMERMESKAMIPCRILCISPGKVGGEPQASCGKMVAVATLNNPMAMNINAPTMPSSVDCSLPRTSRSTPMPNNASGRASRA